MGDRGHTHWDGRCPAPDEYTGYGLGVFVPARAQPRTPVGEFIALFKPTSWRVKGWLPLPKNPTPATPALGPSGLELWTFGPRLSCPLT